MFNDMLMNSRAILGVSLAAVFALSMIMLPVYAGGHLAIQQAEMIKHPKKGVINLNIQVGAKIPTDSTGLFGWALLGWEKTLVDVTHVPAFDDSDFDDKKGGFHTHVLSLSGDTDCASGLKIDEGEDITDPGYKNNVGGVDISIRNVALADLGAKTGAPMVTGFFITAEAGDLCVNPTGLVAPMIKP